MPRLRKKIRHQILHLVLLSNFISVFAWSLFAPLLALYVTDVGGSISQAGYILGFYGVLAGLITVAFGRIEDKSVHFFHHLHIAGSLILSIGSFSYILANDVLGVVLSQAIFAVGFGLLSPAFRKLYGKLQDHGKEATEWGWLEGGDYIMIGLAAIAGGALLQYLGSFNLFIIMGVLQLISTLLIYRSLQKQKKALAGELE